MSTQQSGLKSHIARRLRLGLIIVGIVSLAAMASMLVIAIKKVLDWRGMDTFLTFWLVQDDWLGFLTFFICTTVALMFGLIWRWIYNRREVKMWKQLERK